MGIFTIFVSSGDFHAHEDLVRMNFSHGSLFCARIDANAIAHLQHCRFSSRQSVVLSEMVAPKLDFSFSQPQHEELPAEPARAASRTYDENDRVLRA